MLEEELSRRSLKVLAALDDSLSVQIHQIRNQVLRVIFQAKRDFLSPEIDDVVLVGGKGARGLLKPITVIEHWGDGDIAIWPFEQLPDLIELDVGERYLMACVSFEVKSGLTFIDEPLVQRAASSTTSTARHEIAVKVGGRVFF